LCVVAVFGENRICRIDARLARERGQDVVRQVHRLHDVVEARIVKERNAEIVARRGRALNAMQRRTQPVSRCELERFAEIDYERAALRDHVDPGFAIEELETRSAPIVLQYEGSELLHNM
jgi:hypothetical protein